MHSSSSVVCFKTWLFYFHYVTSCAREAILVLFFDLESTFCYHTRIFVVKMKNRIPYSLLVIGFGFCSSMSLSDTLPLVEAVAIVGYCC